MCRVGVEVAGGREGGKHQPQEPGIAPSVGSSLALPGARPLSSPRTLLTRPEQLRGTQASACRPRGSDKEISVRASFAGGIKYRTGRHSCQAEAGGAVNRTVLFALTKLPGSLIRMWQADSLTLTVTSELRDSVPTSHARNLKIRRMKWFPQDHSAKKQRRTQTV